MCNLICLDAQRLQKYFVYFGGRIEPALNLSRLLWYTTEPSSNRTAMS